MAVWLLKTLCCRAVVKLDLLHNCFFIVLWIARLSHYTTLAPTPHQFTTVHCNALKMHQKSPVKSDTKQCIFGAFLMGQQSFFSKWHETGKIFAVGTSIHNTKWSKIWQETPFIFGRTLPLYIFSKLHNFTKKEHCIESKIIKPINLKFLDETY